MTVDDVVTIAAISVAIVAVLTTAVLTGRKHCPDSPDGEHEDITVRTPDGTCRQCIRCARLTKGIAAFPRI